ncbi:BTAD domain-containing putative transcriptional regulator [Streptomyces sp. NPDC058739]|uniref:AfsR/SARP family transcriptional regulator n=1 Tax=Streptomyces sp. NPDC058739 TaxID=3346618 RepID=UPI0036B8B894
MLEITLFGPRRTSGGMRRVTGGGSGTTLPVPPAAADLLAYLVLNRSLPRPREEIASAFWGELPTSHARRRLNTTLWRLRQAIEPPGTPRGTYVLIEAADTLGFNPDSDALIDVARFETTVASLSLKGAPAGTGHRPGAARELDEESVAQLADAVLLYRGDLLEGAYHDWVITERERLLRLYLSALSRLVGWHRRAGDHDVALHYAQLILDRDPLREDVHRTIIQIHAAAGRRTHALRQYKLCRQLLADELGVEPLPETAAAAHVVDDGVRRAPRQGSGVAGNQVEVLTERLFKAQRELRDLTAVLEQVIGELREMTETGSRRDGRFMRAPTAPPGPRRATKTTRR